MSPGTERFLVGCLSALVAPSIKYVTSFKASIDGGFDISYFIGSSLPFMLMGLIVGLYALVVEKDEKDMKRLFKICIGLPALVMTFGGDIGSGDKAIAMERQLKCEAKPKIVQGIMDTYDQLTSTKRARYWVLSKTVASNEYVMIDDDKFYVIDQVHHLNKNNDSDIVFDVYNCQLKID